MTTHRDRGSVVWFTGLSGAGKTTLAGLLEKEFMRRGRSVEVLDGDVVRKYFGGNLGFSRPDRELNMRRLGYLCQVLIRHGIVVIVAAISPYRDVRAEVRAGCGTRFLEVYVKCPLDTLIQRDVKGLYRRALAGEVPSFTGISDVYEEPFNSDVVVETDRQSPQESLSVILDKLEELEWMPK